MRDFFARFGRWQGLAASYALRSSGPGMNAIAGA